MEVIATYESYNPKRYNSPCVAQVVLNSEGKHEFNFVDSKGKAFGGYTGKASNGEGGQLYISNPVVGSVYAYGQTDRGKKYTKGYEFLQYKGKGVFVEISNTDLISALVTN